MALKCQCEFSDCPHHKGPCNGAAVVLILWTGDQIEGLASYEHDEVACSRCAKGHSSPYRKMVLL